MGDWIDEEKNVCQAISDSYREIVSMMEKKVVFFEADQIYCILASIFHCLFLALHSAKFSSLPSHFIF